MVEYSLAANVGALNTFDVSQDTDRPARLKLVSWDLAISIATQRCITSVLRARNGTGRMMMRVRFLLFGVLLAVAGMVGASLFGAGGTATAMPPSVFRVTITNMTDPPTPISPGALVGHCEDGAFWSKGSSASAELELIAEVGNPGAAVAVEEEETAMGVTFLQERHTIGEVGPGESTSVDVVFEFGCKLSSAHMLVHSNDTFVGANSVGIWDPDTNLPLENVSVELTAHDAGTEENSEIASGFDGGQPDPSRGAENLENGVATSEPISASTQWSGVQATMTIEFLDAFEEEDELESEESTDRESIAENGVEEDGVESDDSGFPNGGSGGLVDGSTGDTSLLTYVFAVLATLAVSVVAVVSRRVVRQQR